MATAVIMPKQGQSVESCIIGKWHKKEGDSVSVGEILFTYETDKAAFEETAKVDGIVLGVFFLEGDDVPCLTTVCAIGAAGEDISSLRPVSATSAGAPAASSAGSTLSAVPVVPTAPSTPAPAPAVPSASARPDRISPRAENLAERTGADLRFAEGTGPAGRVIERDVRRLVDEGRLATPAAREANAALPGAVEGTGFGGRVSTADLASPVFTTSFVAPVATPVPSAPTTDGPEYVEEKLPNIRKVIAKAMHQSISTMAQLTLDTSFDATEILSLRAKWKKARESGLTESLGLAVAAANPTLNDILLFAVSRVLKNHRACNAHFFDDRMVYFNRVHLGMAVDTPRGLMVPTIFNADLLDLAGIAREARAVADACQKGTVVPDQLKGGTFTLTNLGTLGIESFTPVINPPQTCILGVNTLVTRVKDVDGRAVPYQAMTLSLTFDHRALDGAPAARFLKDLKAALENFPLLLMK
jgi:pyruvate dehydrogenase E2 component (dihydrolipoamide acetyltransferase)